MDFSSYTFTLPLENEKTYWWKVKTIDDEGLWTWSIQQNWYFRISTTTHIEKTFPAENQRILVTEISSCTIKFTKHMDTTTINTNTIKIKKKGGDYILLISTYNQSNKTATLTPQTTPFFEPSYIYQIIVSGDVKDETAQAIGNDEIIEFITLMNP